MKTCVIWQLSSTNLSNSTTENGSHFATRKEGEAAFYDLLADAHVDDCGGDDIRFTKMLVAIGNCEAVAALLNHTQFCVHQETVHHILVSFEETPTDYAVVEEWFIKNGKEVRK